VKREIRPVTRDEAVEYLKVLPFANGLPWWEPYPAAWYGGQAVHPPTRPPASAHQLDTWADEIMADPVFHPQAAFVDGRIVGGSAMLSLEITVPGPRPVAMGGVTSTAVVVTHRRRVLLRAIMQVMFDEALSRGEAIATLSASEGGIYGRFGYGPATLRTRWEIERSAAALRPPAVPDPGSAELADAAAARAAWPVLHEIARQHRVGEISPQVSQWASLSDAGEAPDGPLRYVIHRAAAGEIDGIARYRLPWSPDVAEAGVLVVEGLEAVTDDAYRALWELLLDFDLTRRVVAVTRPADEPLRWMLKDPRAMRITRQTDSLWVRFLDVPAALETRRYEADGSLVFEIAEDAMCPANVGTWRLSVSGGTGACAPAAGLTPDLTVEVQSLGSLYLGGMSASLLASAGRIREHHDGAVGLLSRLLRTDPAPFNAIGF
jgi:predicted acetyltransferase